MKKCIKCSETKPLDRFTRDTRYRSGYKSSCKDCHAAYMRNYYLNNPEQAEKDRTRERIRQRGKHVPAWRRHGLSDEQYNVMLDRFDGKCWSCKKRSAKVVDHDHSCCPKPRSCGKCVRGLLCSQCNTAQGLLMDDIDVVAGLLSFMMGGYGNFPVKIEWEM